MVALEVALAAKTLQPSNDSKGLRVALMVLMGAC